MIFILCILYIVSIQIKIETQVFHRVPFTGNKGLINKIYMNFGFDNLFVYK